MLKSPYQESGGDIVVPWLLQPFPPPDPSSPPTVWATGPTCIGSSNHCQCPACLTMDEINGRSFDPVPYTEGVTDMDERARVNKAKDKKKRTEHPSSPVRKLPKFEEPPKDPDPADGGAVGA